MLYLKCNSIEIATNIKQNVTVDSATYMLYIRYNSTQSY